MFQKFILSLCALIWAVPLAAQVQTGLYPNGSYDNVAFDTIDRGSLNVHFVIPIVTKAGRGFNFSYQLVYDGLIWSPVNSAGLPTWTPAADFGLHGQVNDGLEGYVSYAQRMIKCYQQGGSFVWDYIDQNYVYHDGFGVSHPFAYAYNDCTGVETGAGVSPDNSGFSFDGAEVTSPDGKQINAPFNSRSTSGSITDTNGNFITNKGDGTFTDTLGKPVLTVTGSGTAASARMFQYNTPTGTASASISYKTYTVQTNFGCGMQFNQSQDLVDKISLADGSVYHFNYEPTPGAPSNVTGRLAMLTLPQGGAITYTYTGNNNGINCSDGTPEGLTRAGGVGRTYVRSLITSTTSHTDVTDGLGNISKFDFVVAGTPSGFYETQRTVNQTSPSGLLLSRQTCYNTAAPASCTTAALALPITQIDTYETLNGQQHGATLAYNTFGLLTSETDYDFSTNATAHGTVLRHETWAYPTTGIANLISSDTVTDGTNTIGSTAYLYDETTGTGHAALTVTSGLPQHNATSQQRGNLTTIKQYPSTATILGIEAAYEDTGNALNITGPTGKTVFAYDAATHGFTITATPPTPSSTISLPSSATYDANSGMPLTSTDPNNQPVTYKTYDALLRPTEIDYPDGGKMTAGYAPTQTGVYHYLTAGTRTNTQINLENYGRLNWVAVQNSSGGYYWNNYCYDNNGNLQYAAYRFAAPNQNNLSCSGAGDSYTYDALGRVLIQTHADGSTVTYSYKGRATQVADENGVTRITQVDGLGRLAKVCEVSGSTLQGQSPSGCGLDITANGFLTTYTYSTDTGAGNALKTTVTPVNALNQALQTRTFETDWLGRTTQIMQPESGTTTFSYAYSTSAGYGLTVTRTRPEENQPAGSTNTVTTTTQYDSVGRVVSVSYSDGYTPNKAFYYDVNNYWAQTGTNLKGRLAVTGGGTASTWNGSLFSYDAMGRVVNLWACGPATCGTSYQASRPQSFAYDWAGNLIQENDGVSGSILYGRSVAGEVTSITNETYQNLPYNPPNLVSNVVNGPDGPASYTLGNGLNVYLSYDTLGRSAQQWVCNGPAALNCSGGTARYGTASQWKGSQMQFQSDTVLNQQVTFGYGDGFNRLTSRTVTSGTQQNYTYGYDRFGNRVSQTALQGGYNFNPTINPVNNQITTSGYVYDPAGNMLNDTVNTYTYDAEGNVMKVVNASGTTQYVYDVFNRRVHVQTPSAATEFTYDYAGRRISSWLSPNNFGNEGRIYWDGRQIAYRATDGTTYFNHQDLLGTERMRTNYGGTVGSSYTSLPWGDGYTATVNNSAGDQDNGHFAGLEHDAESGTEHAQFRNYASAQGRWLAPDSYLGSYDFTNPQSMNRYAYALNNPVSLVDPTGQEWCVSSVDGFGSCDGGGDGGGGGGGGGGDCDPLFDECGWSWPDDPELGWPGAAPGDSASDNGPLHLEPNWGKDPGSFGESLGFPAAQPRGSWGIAAALGLPGGPGCEFGACGSGNSFQLGPGAIGGTIVCQLAEPCGAIEDATLLLGTIGVVGYDIYQMSRHRGDNAVPKRQFEEALRQIENRCGRPLSPGDRRRLHDDITKQGFSLGEIVEIGVGLFCPGK